MVAIPDQGETLEGSAPKRKVIFHMVSARTAWSGSALRWKGVLCAIGAVDIYRPSTDMDFVCSARAIRPCPSSAQVAGLLRRLVSAALVFFPQPPSQCWRQAHNWGLLAKLSVLVSDRGRGARAALPTTSLRANSVFADARTPIRLAQRRNPLAPEETGERSITVSRKVCFRLVTNHLAGLLSRRLRSGTLRRRRATRCLGILEPWRGTRLTDPSAHCSVPSARNVVRLLR